MSYQRANDSRVGSYQSQMLTDHLSHPLLYMYIIQLQYELSDRVRSSLNCRSQARVAISQSFLTSRSYRLTLTIISRPRIDSAAAVYSPIIDRVSFFPTRGRSCTVYAYAYPVAGPPLKQAGFSLKAFPIHRHVSPCIAGHRSSSRRNEP